MLGRQCRPDQTVPMQFDQGLHYLPISLSSNGLHTLFRQDAQI